MSTTEKYINIINETLIEPTFGFIIFITNYFYHLLVGIFIVVAFINLMHFLDNPDGKNHPLGNLIGFLSSGAIVALFFIAPYSSGELLNFLGAVFTSSALTLVGLALLFVMQD